MAVQPPDGWQFVNISEPKKQKKDETIRKTVRANAMRDFRRKQKEERQASTQTHAHPHAHKADEARKSDVPPEALAILQYAMPESMPGFLGDDRLHEGALGLCCAEMRQLLGNLESMSLTELTAKNEEELARQAEQQVFDPSTAPEWFPDESSVLSRRISRGLVQQKIATNPSTLLDSGVEPFNAMPALGNARYVPSNHRTPLIF